MRENPWMSAMSEMLESTYLLHAPDRISCSRTIWNKIVTKTLKPVAMDYVQNMAAWLNA